MENLLKLLKNNLNIVAISTLFIIGMVGLWNFESISIFKIILSLLGLGFAYFAISLKNWQFLVYLTLYLNIFNLYFIYENLGWYLGVVMVMMIIFMLVINFLSFDFKTILEVLNQKLFYCSLLTLLDLEIFLTLISWPTSIMTKTIIIVTINYLLWGILENYRKETFNLKTIIPYIITSGVAIILSIVTTPWYTY